MSSAAPLSVGTKIAGYSIEGVLGRGAMAVVYRASHPDREHPVALKLIASDSSRDDEQRERSKREARLAAAVVHRNILPIYEAGEYEGQLFVAMKLEAADLGALLRQEGRLRASRAVSLVSQVASALDVAHAHGLVHRDVKPQNVLVGEEEGQECAYVADFGVARAAFSNGQLMSDEMVGTVGYASPEQIRGEPVDHRADIYALGCLLYECLTGRVPFARGSSLATMWAHLHEELPEPSILVPALPSALDAVVRRALAKSPEARYGSAGALAKAAREAVGISVPEKPPRDDSRVLPTGTVTFLFSDVEGSTRLLRELGEEGYAAELEAHRRAIREACTSQGGVEVDTQGDAFFFAFAQAEGAVCSAEEITASLAETQVRVRIGIHSGTPHVTSEGYVGQDVHRAARIAASAHGGQVVLSQASAELLAESSLASALSPLGSHRLKDFPEPVRLFQLGEGAFPPLKTIANTNLPTPATSFVGRAAELAEAGALLEKTRLLSVTGPGGAGKTRFALELARRAREERFSDYEDGVFSCFLSALRDPALVLTTIAQTLALPEEPGRSALETLSSRLQGKRLLLLLDNMEHLLPCAGELSELLARCPGLSLLLTSRELLRLQGEQPYLLPPLTEVEGIALFCERGRVAPSEPIAELCRRLEGLPLALELAAARMRLLSPEQLLARLSKRLDLLKGIRDADPRQQTLRATIHWSYDLLSPQEQALFARLSVFAGGCTLEAAEEVCEADLDALESLLDKSLLRRSEDRFWMLETIREFAAERLEESGKAKELGENHTRYFTLLAENLEPQLHLARAGASIEQLDADYENLRAALAFSLEERQVELLLRLASALVPFWGWRGHVEEGSRWLEAALRTSVSTLAPLRVRVLNGAANLALEMGDLERHRRLNEESLQLAREVGDRLGQAAALHDLALAIELTEQSHSRAAEMLEEAERLFSDLSDEGGAVLALTNLGNLYRRTGEHALAEARLEEAVDRGRKVANERVLAAALGELGLFRLEDEDLVSAGWLLREAIRLAGEARNDPIAIYVLSLLAGEAVALKAPLRAARLAGAAVENGQRTGIRFEAEDDSRLELYLEEARASADDSAFSAAWAEGAAMSLEEAVGYALEDPKNV